MVAGENPDKVVNIVKGNMAGLQALYHPIINSAQIAQSVSVHLVKTPNGDVTFEQGKTMQSALQLLALLPSKWQLPLQHRMVMLSDPNDDFNTTLKKALSEQIFHVVQTSSTSQTLKGIATAGLKKTAIYSCQKLGKMWDGYMDRR